MPSYLRTSDLAKAVGVHPNTIRLYEKLGFLPPVPRSPSGYRLFTEDHLAHARLIRLALHFTWLAGDLKHSAYTMVLQAASGDLGGALELAYQLLVLVQAERARAEAAAELLKRWAQGTTTDTTAKPLHIGETAKLLGVTTDQLRNWERNGLLVVPRNPRNGYRLYGAAEIGRLRVIRMLLRAGYSIMAILRMLRYLDQDRGGDPRQVLDTPRPDEDTVYVTDRWLSALEKMEQAAADAIALLEEMIRRRSGKDIALIADPPSSAYPLDRPKLCQILEIVLDRIVPVVGAKSYRLCGTAAALLQGISLPVRDVNILTRERTQVDAFATALSDFPCLTSLTLSEDEKQYLAEYKIHGIAVSMSTVEWKTDSDAIECLGRGPWEHFVLVPCGAHTVPTVALELRLVSELLRGRPNRYIPLIKHMQANGCDVKLVRRGMEARGLSQTLQRDILNQLKG
jgi:DNA-binding transcriptional MerR regulator